MRPGGDESLGQRVAYHRQRRGMSQRTLAELVGRSEEWLSQIERGDRELDRLSMIVALAQALRVEFTRLLPSVAEAVSTYPSRSSAPDHVPEIRRSLTRYEAIERVTRGYQGPPPDLADLRRRVSQAKFFSQNERWSELGLVAADLIRDSHVAVRLHDGSAQREAHSLQSLAYHVTSGMLDRIGETDLPWIAAERAMSAAERADDPLLAPLAAWRLSVVLRHAGRIEESRDVPVAAADALRAQVGPEDPRAASLYGSLMLKAAVASSTLGEAREVRDLLKEVDRAATITGDRNDYWLAFGPANVRVHRAWLALEMGDPTDALDKAAAVSVDSLPEGVAERA